MFDSKIFSARVRSLRKEAGLSQKELGQSIGLTLQALSDIENGRRTTTFEKLYALADYFNVSTDYLLGRTDRKKADE